MRQAVMAVCVVALMAAGAGLSGPVSGDSPGDGIIAIAVAPGTIALDAATQWLTIHADIPFGLVDLTTVVVEVEGIEVEVGPTFADSLGDLVVKCPIDEVKAAIAAGAREATVVLYVTTGAGVVFMGSDTVKVTKEKEAPSGPKPSGPNPSGPKK